MVRIVGQREGCAGEAPSGQQEAEAAGLGAEDEGRGRGGFGGAAADEGFEAAPRRWERGAGGDGAGGHDGGGGSSAEGEVEAKMKTKSALIRLCFIFLLGFYSSLDAQGSSAIVADFYFGNMTGTALPHSYFVSKNWEGMDVAFQDSGKSCVVFCSAGSVFKFNEFDKLEWRTDYPADGFMNIFDIDQNYCYITLTRDDIKEESQILEIDPAGKSRRVRVPFQLAYPYKFLNDAVIDADGDSFTIRNSSDTEKIGSFANENADISIVQDVKDERFYLKKSGTRTVISTSALRDPVDEMRILRTDADGGAWLWIKTKILSTEKKIEDPRGLSFSAYDGDEIIFKIDKLGRMTNEQDLTKQLRKYFALRGASIGLSVTPSGTVFALIFHNQPARRGVKCVSLVRLEKEK
jgi:hypothetical protein